MVGGIDLKPLVWILLILGLLVGVGAVKGCNALTGSTYGDGYEAGYSQGATDCLKGRLKMSVSVSVDTTYAK